MAAYNHNYDPSRWWRRVSDRVVYNPIKIVDLRLHTVARGF